MNNIKDAEEMTAASALYARLQAQARRDLTRNVLPFWTRHTLDAQNGGFFTIVNWRGQPNRAADKTLIAQTRMVWALSACCRAGLEQSKLLQMAEHGAKFLTDVLWDDERDGFYWSVSATGESKNTDKVLVGQCFALLALAEYSRVAPATEKTGALGWCAKIFDLIQQRTRDGENGYFEDFDGNWQRIEDSYCVRGAQSGKTLGAHLHILEAFTTLVRADPQPRYRMELEALVALLQARMFHPDGFAREPFDDDWQPVKINGQYLAFYGHNVEFAWLLLEAARVLGNVEQSVGPFFGMVDHALRFGFDHGRGGLATVGTYDGKLISEIGRLKKCWWEQAEMLAALQEAWLNSGDEKYLRALQKQWSWIYYRHIDRIGGDWFPLTDWHTGWPSGWNQKGWWGWRTFYHHGRAVLRLGFSQREI